ncbi:hypothetical protein DL95DRAFT_467674 [Leptodontidium sp. 2 PMI_412]|nr:hypothetical protein DL95DRAFT_467674 [Leptodontidium sp. 2 PMI_412]
MNNAVIAIIGSKAQDELERYILHDYRAARDHISGGLKYLTKEAESFQLDKFKPLLLELSQVVKPIQLLQSCKILRKRKSEGDVLDEISKRQRTREREDNVSEVLKLSADRFEIMFPALETLSLSDISLENAQKRIAYAFNAHELSSLTLRHCSGSEEFLNEVIGSGQTIKLSLLEGF